MAFFAFVLSCVLGLLRPDEHSLLPKIFEVFGCRTVAARTSFELRQQQHVKVMFMLGLYALPTVASIAPPAHPQHIFLLAGQSNMVGHGGLKAGAAGQEYWDGYVPCECQPDQRIFRLNADSSWTRAQEPIHAGIFPGMKVTGIGPSMPFAKHILKLVPGFGTIGLVPCAYDWTNLREWAKNSNERSPLGPGTTLFQNLIERANASMRTGGKIAALFWWQGGKDAGNAKDTRLYKKRLGEFFESVRADLGRSDLPVIMILLSEEKANFTKVVRAAQQSLELPNLIKVDPPKVKFEPDGMHVNSDGQVAIGTKVAEDYCQAGFC